MGANSTQAVAITLFLIAFVLLAGAFAGGGARAVTDGFLSLVLMVLLSTFLTPPLLKLAFERPRI